MTHPRYPITRTTEATDELAGVRFSDPYRWLEEDTAEVRTWQTEQASAASAYVEAWPYFDAVKDLVDELHRERFNVLPVHAGGRWFRMDFAPGATQARVVVARGPAEPGEVVFDPLTVSAEKPPFVSWIAPSPDGKILALGLCADGSENNTIRLIDVATKALLSDPPPQVLMDNWLNGVQWLPDSSGFFFSALASEAVEFVQRVYFHKIGSPPPQSPIEMPAGAPAVSGVPDYGGVVVSDCGRWAVYQSGMMLPRPVALLDLRAPDATWRPFISEDRGQLAGFLIGDRFIGITDVDAPRGRVVAVPLNVADPNNPEDWIELVPESESVLRNLTPVGDSLYVSEFVDTYSRIRIFSASGTPVGEVPLPGRGAISELPFPLMNLFKSRSKSVFAFAFSSFTSSWGLYLHRPDTEGLETIKAPEIVLDAVVEDHWAISSDGVRVPYHIVRRNDLAPGPQPALIYAYGGYNAPMPPSYQADTTPFFAAGGIYVHAHIRGGAELGRDWWFGGRFKNKQKSYDDLYAIAGDLFKNGVTTAKQLGITGGSNGGLMCGVVATQRPQLWKVCIPRVPAFDQIGSCRDAYGRMAIAADLADPDDPDDVRRLASISPYHLVLEGTHYPAIFISAGNTDPRCPPWHSRKFAARLQAAQAAGEPILVHIWENAGHGWANARDVEIRDTAECLAFAMERTGLVPKSTPKIYTVRQPPAL